MNVMKSDPLLDWMEENGIELTWYNYLEYAYGGVDASDCG